MTLIKSISGIRWTIWWRFWEWLTPIDIVLYTSAFAQLIKNNTKKTNPKIIVWRDARISWKMVSDIVINTLIWIWTDVVDLWLSTTPTVEMAVIGEQADGWIILTASHNPTQRNALKLLNQKWEFISAEDWQVVLDLAQNMDFDYASIEQVWKIEKIDNYISIHNEKVLKLPLVKKDFIAQSNLKIIVDAINSTGSIAISDLLDKLWIKDYKIINSEMTWNFSHNPEPLAENLTQISEEIRKEKADLWIVVDPDVDRLAFVCEDGTMFGEEYTLVAVSDYILQNQKWNTVSNLSSTRALKDITNKYWWEYLASAVGEVNVVNKMKEINAIIWWEWNGWIIYPELHYGRDALVGIALFLSHFASQKISMTEFRKTFPEYFMIKNKIELKPEMDVDLILNQIKQKFSNEEINDIDWVKIDFIDWRVHLRKSNTEPIIRIYAEWKTPEKAEEFVNLVKNEIQKIIVF